MTSGLSLHCMKQEQDVLEFLYILFVVLGYILLNYVQGVIPLCRYDTILPSVIHHRAINTF